jgi:septal ring factor EnvC (AmiA/AmiB activator)
MTGIRRRVQVETAPARVSATTFLLLFFLFASGLSPSLYAAKNDAETKKKLELVRARIQLLKETLRQARGKKSKVQKDLYRVEQKINHIGRALHGLHQDIRKQEKNLSGLNRERKALSKQLGKQREMLASQVRASYAMGRQEQVKIILNQGDPSTIQRALVYYDYLNRSRTRRIKEVITQIRRLQTLEEKIAHEKQALEKLLARQSAERKQLQAQRKERRTLLLALTREIRSKDSRLDRMLQDEKELQRVLRAVEKALSDIPASITDSKPIRQRKGRLSWPTRGRIITKFNGIRSLKANLRWTGVRIRAKQGDDVHAISRGRVAFADWLRGYGLLMIIDHGDGFMSLYGHNQSIYKEIGEWVNEGEVIASVGNSGGQNRSSLYFELRKNGKPVNPERWCRRTRHGLVGLRH